MPDGSCAPRFSFRPMRLSDAFAASRWRYPDAMYDLGLAPLLVATLLRGPFAALAGVSYFAVATHDDPFVGVLSLTHRGRDIEIGVGLRPDLNGRGLGLPYLLDALAMARQRYHPRTFSLYVATFNRRAIAVYERAGFIPNATRQFIYHGERYDEVNMSRAAD